MGESSFPYDSEYDTLLHLLSRWDAVDPQSDFVAADFWATFLEWSRSLQLLSHPLESAHRLLWAYWSADRAGTARVTTDLTQWGAEMFPEGGILRGLAFLAPEPIPLPVLAQWPERVKQFGRWKRAAVLTWEVDTVVTEHDSPGVIAHKRFWGRQSPRPWTADFRRGEGFTHWRALPTGPQPRPASSTPILKDQDWPREVTRLLDDDRPDSAFWEAWRHEWHQFIQDKPRPTARRASSWSYAGWALFGLSMLWNLWRLWH